MIHDLNKNLDDFDSLISNLRKEGQISRAENVQYLIMRIKEREKNTIKNIYKIHYFVHERIKGKIELIEHDKTVIINNLDYAISIFNDYKQRVMMYEYQGHSLSGKVELFEPHIHDNGLLAYWPDNEHYIREYKLNL